MALLLPQIRSLLESDRRYRLEAYQFVQDSLLFAQRVMRMGNERMTEDASHQAGGGPLLENHLTGQELCAALRLRAIDQFGYLAKEVLNGWGVRSTSDFGEIVYNLIQAKCFKKSKSDRREDFDAVYDFEEAFRVRYRIDLPSESS